MNITRFSDYSLRILIYLASNPSAKSTAATIAQAYDISFHHTAKAAQWLTRKNYVHSSERGRGGGLSLARTANHINIGDVLRAAEAHAGSPMVECMGEEGGSCVISPSCGLSHALAEAQNAFFNCLSGFTLADITEHKTALIQLLDIPAK